MSKSKLPILWYKCEKCNYFIPKREKTLHYCTLNKNQAYILENNFYGFLKFITQTPIDANFNECLNYIFLHSSVIKLCKYQIGQYVYIELDQKKFVKQVYPISTEDEINYCLTLKESLNLSTLNNSQNVKISAFNETILLAKEIHVEIEDRLFNENNLNKYFYKKILHENENILFHSNGKFINILLRNIFPFENDCILNSLKNLNLNNEQNYTIHHTTEWKIIKNENIQKEIQNMDVFGNEPLLLDMKNILNMGFSNNFPHSRFQPRGILLYGPQGSGKTTLISVLVQEINVFSIFINAGDIISKFFGETEKKLNEILLYSKKKTPSLIIIDDLDILCPKRSSNDIHKRIILSLIDFMDNLEIEDSVMIIGITSNIENIEPSLRRTGRLDREYELVPPNSNNRYQILKSFIYKQNDLYNIHDEDIEDISNITGGFVIADLFLFCHQAKLQALDEQIPLSKKHFLGALNEIKPSAMRQVMSKVPNVKWSEIGGQEIIKLKLEQAIVWPLKHPESLKRFGISPPKGFLLFGPPGCSKTLIAKALATESKLHFLQIKGPEIFSKWVGESEKAVRQIFRRARQVSPSIIFFDEIDAIASPRENTLSSTSDVQGRVLTELLTQLDGVEPLGDVIVIGATNRPDRIDPALLRPGRLTTFYVPLPDPHTRREIFSIEFKKMLISTDVNIEHLVEKTEGFSGAEITDICQEAGWTALKEDIQIKQINFSHFIKVLKDFHPKTPHFLIEIYNKFINK